MLNCTLFRFIHPLNALFPIRITLSGILISLMLKQPGEMPGHKFSKLLKGSVMSFKDLVLLKKRAFNN